MYALEQYNRTIETVTILYTAAPRKFQSASFQVVVVDDNKPPPQSLC